MADLKPLIRYRKHIVDEKQKFVAQLMREAEKLDQQKKVVEDQIQREIDLAASLATAEAQEYLGKYLQGARRKVKALEGSIAKMNARISAAQEDMRAAFAEMKKVDIIQQRRDDREGAEQKRKEDQALDEVALDGFRRREDENQK